jgi:thiol:disulfide interchange protein DsbA
MKHLFWVAAALFALAACSKEEPSAPVEDAAAVEAPAPEAVADEAATEETEEAAAETLEVVEESASEEAEPENEPIVLAVADTEVEAREWKYKEGQHYFRLMPTQPTVGGADKIEVAETFMYSCPHCFTLEPYIQKWLETKDPGVRFVRIPAVFNRLAMMHAQTYYTAELLEKNGMIADLAAFNNAAFIEYHNRGNRLTRIEAIQKLFERFNVSAEEFDKAWNSFPVNQKMRVGADLARRYGITSVPTIVVNGKYRTSAADAGGYDQLLELIDELTVREGLR